MESLKENLLPALIRALVICLLKVFVLPWEIWTGTVTRLAQIQKNDATDNVENSEFPVMVWLKTAFDGFLFLGYPVILLFMIISLFNVGGSVLIMYFMPIPYSIFKEMMTLGLSIALNLEKVAQK